MASRRRPEFLVADQRLRHPLNAHAPPRVGDPPEVVSRSAAALQLWHRNTVDPWEKHGNVRYPQLAFWAAGVSERNREDPGHLDRAWNWTQTPTGADGSYAPTSLHELATATTPDWRTLEGRLRRKTSWERADPAGCGLPALSAKGVRPTALGPRPRRFFGLQRLLADGDNPARLTAVVGAEFPLADPPAGARDLSMQLPSGFAVSRASKLENSRRMRAQQRDPDPDWLQAATTLVWTFNLEIPADDLDLLPGPSDDLLPLEAVREMLASRAWARALAKGMPPFTFAPAFAAAPGFDGIFRLNGELRDNEPHGRGVEAADLSLDVDASFRLTAGPGVATWPAVTTHEGAPLAGGAFVGSDTPVKDEETELAEDLREEDADPRKRFLAQRIVLRVGALALADGGDRLRLGAFDLRLRRLAGSGTPLTETDEAVRLTLAPAVARIGGLSGLRVRLI